MIYSENLGSYVDDIKSNDNPTIKETKRLINKYNSLKTPGEKVSYHYNKDVINLNNDLRKYYMKIDLLNNEFPPTLKLTKEELELTKTFIKSHIRLFHMLNTNMRTDQILLCFMLLTIELYGYKYWDFRIRVCKKHKINCKNYKRFLTNLTRLKLYRTPMKPIEIGETNLKCAE